MIKGLECPVLSLFQSKEQQAQLIFLWKGVGSMFKGQEKILLESKISSYFFTPYGLIDID